MTQRPDLFRVAIPMVGVMDMMRFHKFTVGFGWIDDYGNPDDAKFTKYIHGYSPFHNIKAGTKYPATMVTTGDHDDRVVPELRLGAESLLFRSERRQRSPTMDAGERAAQESAAPRASASRKEEIGVRFQGSGCQEMLLVP